jgi:hypothetical protein
MLLQVLNDLLHDTLERQEPELVGICFQLSNGFNPKYCFELKFGKFFKDLPVRA